MPFDMVWIATNTLTIMEHSPYKVKVYLNITRLVSRVSIKCLLTIMTVS